jgi:hypothetical protein
VVEHEPLHVQHGDQSSIETGLKIHQWVFGFRRGSVADDQNTRRLVVGGVFDLGRELGGVAAARAERILTPLVELRGPPKNHNDLSADVEPFVVVVCGSLGGDAEPDEDEAAAGLPRPGRSQRSKFRREFEVEGLIVRASESQSRGGDRLRRLTRIEDGKRLKVTAIFPRRLEPGFFERGRHVIRRLFDLLPAARPAGTFRPGQEKQILLHPLDHGRGIRRFGIDGQKRNNRN